MIKQKVSKALLFCTLFITILALVACSKSDSDDSGSEVDGSAVHNEADTQNTIKDGDSSQTSSEDTNSETGETEDDSTKPVDDKQDEDEGNADEGKEDEENKDEDTTKTDEVAVGTLPLVEGGIKSVYEQLGMMAGTCINNNVLSQSIYADHIIENYNSVTMENDMKPDYSLNKEKSIQADDLVVEFNQATISMLEWAKTNGIAVRGHTIIWHSQTPQWIFHEGFDTSKPKVDRDTMLKRMESYIKQVFEQLDTLGYLEIFYAYDVVNEAIEDNGTYRNSAWKEIIGEDYIWYAFHYADKYAPEHVKLFYNDYNEQFKTQYIMELVKSLVDENGEYLIDGIGCQAHLYTQDSIDDYMKTLEAFSTLGLDVQLTEIEVSLGTWTNILQPTEENLLAQGQYYYELVNRIGEGNKAGTTRISAITFWGISDRYSWRADRNPLLFDKNFQPKYAYFGAVQIRENAGF